MIAVSGLLISMLIFLTSTYIGSVLDKTDRMYAMRLLVVAETTIVASMSYRRSFFFFYFIVRVSSYILSRMYASCHVLA